MKNTALPLANRRQQLSTIHAMSYFVVDLLPTWRFAPSNMAFRGMRVRTSSTRSQNRKGEIKTEIYNQITAAGGVFLGTASTTSAGGTLHEWSPKSKKEALEEIGNRLTDMKKGNKPVLKQQEDTKSNEFPLEDPNTGESWNKPPTFGDEGNGAARRFPQSRTDVGLAVTKTVSLDKIYTFEKAEVPGRDWRVKLTTLNNTHAEGDKLLYFRKMLLDEVLEMDQEDLHKILFKICKKKTYKDWIHSKESPSRGAPSAST